MRESVWLRVKTYSYWKDNNNEDKKGKDRKKGVIKKPLKFQDYKNCLEADQVKKRKKKHLEKKKIEVKDLRKIKKNS